MAQPIDAELLRSLACPECGGSVVEAGVDSLRCSACGRSYARRNGIPRLNPVVTEPGQKRTAAAFGWEWRHFTDLHPEYEEQFLDWIKPLRPESFRGARVLDAGCGIGRHAYYAATWGAKEVVALDFSDAVETARRNLDGLPNTHVVQGDLLRPPLKPAGEGDGGFDIVYSIGVLHHLPEPAAGIRSLAALVNPRGLLVVWVYGHEGNALVRATIEPLRRVTSRLPPSLLRILVWPLAVALHGTAKLIYGPGKGHLAGRRLPLGEYLASLAAFGFRQNYSIAFDQLVAPTTTYVRRGELRSWLRSAGLEDVTTSRRNGNSWRAQGRKPALSARDTA
jgi:SAM-dependent methyltransferase